MTRSASVDTHNLVFDVLPLTLILMPTDQTDKDYRFCGFCCITRSSCNQVPLYVSKDKKCLQLHLQNWATHIVQLVRRKVCSYDRVFHHFPISSANICSLYVLKSDYKPVQCVELTWHSGWTLPSWWDPTHCFEWWFCVLCSQHPVWAHWGPSSGSLCGLCAGGLGSHWRGPDPAAGLLDKLQKQMKIYHIFFFFYLIKAQH